jgi:hypothetical protein
MNSSVDYSSRLRELFLDGHWIANTNYSTLLADVPYEVAIKQVHSLNTIAALTFHMNYYLQGLKEVMEGKPLAIHDQYSYDLRPLANEHEWRTLVQTLETNAARFIELVSMFNAEEWSRPFVDQRYGTWQRNIEGVLEHGYYHLGQMVLLKKLALVV